MTAAATMRRRATYYLAVGVALLCMTAVLVSAVWATNRGAVRMHDAPTSTVRGS